MNEVEEVVEEVLEELTSLYSNPGESPPYYRAIREARFALESSCDKHGIKYPVLDW